MNAEERFQNVERSANEALNRWTAHEAVCAERYRNIERFMGTASKLLWVVAGYVFSSLVGMVVYLVGKHGLG